MVSICGNPDGHRSTWLKGGNTQVQPAPVEPGAAHASAMLAREGAGLVVAVARMRRNDRGCWARPDQGTVQGTAAEHGV